MVRVRIKPTAPHHTIVLRVSVKKNSTTRSFARVISFRLSKNLAKDGTLAKSGRFTLFWVTTSLSGDVNCISTLVTICDLELYLILPILFGFSLRIRKFSFLTYLHTATGLLVFRSDEVRAISSNSYAIIITSGGKYVFEMVGGVSKFTRLNLGWERGCGMVRCLAWAFAAGNLSFEIKEDESRICATHKKLGLV